MKYRTIILFFFIVSCAQNYSKSDLKNPFKSTGFAYIYNNYEKILSWNRSLRFALAVCTLKDNFKNEI